MAANIIKAGTPITFAAVPGQAGWPATADRVSLEVFDDKQQSVWQGTDVPWVDFVTAGGITFPAVASQLAADQTSGYRIYGMFVRNSMGGVLWKQFYEVIVEASNQLRPLVNSFATWGQLMLVQRTMPNMTGFQCCTSLSGAGAVGEAGESNAQLVAALITAWHNIAQVNVNFCPPNDRVRYHDQSHMWDHEGIFDTLGTLIRSTRQLTPELWEKIKPWQRDALIRAQLIEANYLLSGNTPEKQRISGLLSHSAGESAHFYRTSKPLDLPVSRETAKSLKGIITYVARIGG